MLSCPKIVSLVSETLNDKHNIDSISRCKNLDEKSLPSSSSDITYVLTKEMNSPVANHSKESEMVDKSEMDNSWSNTQTSLDEILDVCVNVIDNDDTIFDGLIQQFENGKENGSTSQLHSNLHNHERHIFVKHTRDGNSCAIKKKLAYFNTKKKIQTIEKKTDYDNVPRQKPRSRHEVAIGVPNIFIDQSSEIEQSKKSTRKFVQKGICLGLPSKIEKCIECRVHQMRKNLTKCDYDNISCRFYAFRQLKFNKSGKLIVAGYPDPYKNLNIIDMGMWLPGEHASTPSKFNIRASMKILEDAGGQFCKFVQDENEALELNWPNERKRRKILWKKCVNGVRELCDVCKTTIFNHHWSCRKCGFVVCLDCFRTKFNDTQLTQTQNNSYNKHRNKNWLLCSNEIEHQVEQLSITQILAGDALNFISKLMHRTCVINNILLNCNCNQKIKIRKPYKSHISVSANAFSCYVYKNNISEVIKKENLLLKTLLNKHAFHYNYQFCESGKTKSLYKDYLVVTNKKNQNPMDEHFVKTKEIFAPKLTLTSDDESNLPHMWLCEGHLLRLLNPKSNENYEIFQVFKNISLIFSHFIS